MGQVVVYSHRSAVSNAAAGPGSGGGDVEDILRRLGNVETCVVDLKTQVAFIAANMPHLATAKSVSDLRTEMKESLFELRTDLMASISEVKSELGDFKSEVKSEFGEVKSEISRIAAIIPHLATAASVSALETRMIKWFVGTAITLTALAFSIAKFVH